MGAHEDRHDDGRDDLDPVDPVDEAEDPAGDVGAEYRDETEGERLDRKWGELLQELRVMQTGAQLTAGFLLTLPFTPAFEDIDAFQLDLYLALVLLAGITTALVLTPVATHRRLSGRKVKGRLVEAADRIVKVVLGMVGALIIGMVVLIFDVTIGRTASLSTGAVLTLLVLGLMVWLPSRLVSRAQEAGVTNN